MILSRRQESKASRREHGKAVRLHTLDPHQNAEIGAAERNAVVADPSLNRTGDSFSRTNHDRNHLSIRPAGSGVTVADLAGRSLQTIVPRKRRIRRHVEWCELFTVASKSCSSGPSCGGNVGYARNRSAPGTVCSGIELFRCPSSNRVDFQSVCKRAVCCSRCRQRAWKRVSREPRLCDATPE